MNYIDETHKVIARALADSPYPPPVKGNVAYAPPYCVGALRSPNDVQQVVKLGLFLKSLEGCMVKKVTAAIVEDRLENPDGFLGNFVVELEASSPPECAITF